MRQVFVYTAMFGDYDAAPPTICGPQRDIAYYCFSDADRNIPDPWKIVHVERYFADNKLSSSFLKANPHLLFPKDCIAVWVDASLKDIRLTSTGITELLAGGSVAAPRHRIRTKIRQEAAVIVAAGLDHPIRVTNHLAELDAAGFPDEDGLSATTLVIRDRCDPRVQCADVSWWDWIVRGSRRDQLSFNAALWAAGLEWQEIDVDWREPNSIFTRVIEGKREGRLLATQARGLDCAPLSFQQLQMPALPDDYPPVCIWHRERWSAGGLALIRSLNACVLAAGEDLEGNYCYFHRARIDAMSPPDPRRSWKREFLRRAAQGCVSALEIGFNAGHSAAIMLDCNPMLSLCAIDIGHHKYSRPCAELIQRQYGDRFNSMWGSSREVLDRLAPQEVERFDLVHIDGGHLEEDYRQDLEWFLRFARPGALLMVDDAYVPHIRALTRTALAAGLLQETMSGLPSSGENRLFAKCMSLARERL